MSPLFLYAATLVSDLGAVDEVLARETSGFRPPGAWFFQTRGYGAVDDATGLEVAFALHGVDAGRAVLLSATPGASVAIDAKSGSTPAATAVVRRVRMQDGGDVLTGALDEKTSCSPLEDGFWSGAEVRVLAARPPPDRAFPSAVIVLDDHPELGALVLLAPGDSVETRAVSRRGVRLRETLSVRHAASGVLELRRAADRQTVCFHAETVGENPSGGLKRWNAGAPIVGNAARLKIRPGHR
jgi:hypothetical protein